MLDVLHQMGTVEALNTVRSKAAAHLNKGYFFSVNGVEIKRHSRITRIRITCLSNELGTGNLDPYSLA